MPRVSIQDRPETYDVPQDSILFDALADRGLELPHGCLAGSCGACRIHVAKGAENLAPPSAIEQNTIEAIREEYIKTGQADFIAGKHIRLSCRAKIKDDVSIVPLAKK